MNSNLKCKWLALGSAAVLSLTVLAGCADETGGGGGGGGGQQTDTLIVMTEDLNGLYNPFYSSAGTDMDVVGQTQIAMLTTDSDGDIAFGNDEATVTLDYEKKTSDGGQTTDYYFVLKNGLKFSDGTPLTMNDVMFNLYVYLDPAYAGSSTMYSTKIKGLQTYRTQTWVDDEGTGQESELTTTANSLATRRLNVLSGLYHTHPTQPGSQTYSANINEMRNSINTWTPGDTALNQYLGTFLYSSEIDSMSRENKLAKGREQLLADYNNIVGARTTLDTDGYPAFQADGDNGKYYDELVVDYNSAQSAYKEEPYKSSPIPFDEIVSFMYMEGFVTPKYTDPAKKDKIEDLTLNYPSSITTMDAAIKYVWTTRITSSLDAVLSSSSSANLLSNEYVSQGKDVALHNTLSSADGQLSFPNISGVRSLAPDHRPDGDTESYAEVTADNTITVNDTVYNLATAHNNDGTPVSGNDVLRIRVVGTDPKAVWNFGFTVSPYRYYSDTNKYHVNIKNNEFGVEWASFEFQQGVLQGNNYYGQSKNKVPLGAGPYVATDINNSDTPAANAFFSNNFVYYKANELFSLNGTDSAAPKIKKMRYQVVSSYNALPNLENGDVHFVEPQFTKENNEKVEALKARGGFDSVSTWNLGYGYIGINAAKVQSLSLRKAIMAAMNINLAKEYYLAGTVETISWPMSLMSWAYPRTVPIDEIDYAHPAADTKSNGKDYITDPRSDFDRAAAKRKIQQYMGDANANTGDPRLTVTFTIAGSQLTEHPCYQVFKEAMDLLNECGWNVSVNPDTYALTKLATGSLAVWAAAWGSTIDPDMYQVYHKNSTATSTLAWGYNAILSSQSAYPQENAILNQLANYIDDARETDNQTTRRTLYEAAMGLVLDLAVELPVYQRQVLYAFNTNVIDVNTLPHDSEGRIMINAYTSPLSRIWEVDFVH